MVTSIICVVINLSYLPGQRDVSTNITWFIRKLKAGMITPAGTRVSNLGIMPA